MLRRFAGTVIARHARPVATVLLCAALAACATMGDLSQHVAGGGTAATAQADHAERLYADGQLDQAANEFLALAAGSRGDAAALVEAGHVRLNGKKVGAASQLVRTGDVVTVALDRAVRVLKVEGFAEKRGDASFARGLYRDLTAGSVP